MSEKRVFGTGVESVPAASTGAVKTFGLPALLFVAVLFAWAAVACYLSESLVNARSVRLLERERDVALSTAASISTNVGFSLASMRSIPRVMAKDAEIETVLARFGADVRSSDLPPPDFRARLQKNPDLRGLSKKLESAVSELEVDQIWVINAAGDCIAAGGFPDGSSPIGVNYIDREYFQAAQQFGSGRQFAVGRTTHLPGIFYSAAVLVDNRFVGAVVVKTNLRRLSWMVVLDNNTFITDENGVVIIAGDARFLMSALPGVRLEKLSQGERQNRYLRSDFDLVAIKPEPEPLSAAGPGLVRLDGRDGPMLEISAEIQPGFLTARIFRDMSGLQQIRQEGVWIFIALFFAGALGVATLLGGAIYIRRGKAHRAEIARVNTELVQLNEALMIQVRFDSLTGCSNRRHFFEELTLELKRSSRFDLPCCLAVLDIDHFKQVNDRYGHAAGDEVLKGFSATVGKCLRSSDLLGRTGGEEFAVLMPQTSLAGALELAERIRSAVEGCSVSFGPIEVSCTVSIGVAEWRAEDDSEKDFLARADKSMYAAKRSGRNRVCSEADTAS